MSTRHFSPDDLVPFVAAILLTHARYQTDLYPGRGGSAERTHRYIQDAGMDDLLAGFMQANAKAVALRYREDTPVMEWAQEHSAAVFTMIRPTGLPVAMLARLFNEVSLLRYNLDESATVESLEFCLQATNAVMRLIARPDVATAAGR